MRKFLINMLVLCFATAGLSPAYAQTSPKIGGTPAVVVQGAGAQEEKLVPGTAQPGVQPGVTPGTKPDTTQPAKPTDIGPLPEQLRELFQHFMQGAQVEEKAKTPAELESLYKNVWQRVADTYYDHDALQNWGEWKNKYDGKLTTQDELEVAIKVMMASLHDKWTKYTTSAEIKAQMAKSTAGMEPLGFFLKQLPDKSYVIEFMMYGTPAQKSILRKGDVVKSINGKQLDTLTTEQVEEISMAKAGDDVQVIFVLDGKEETLTLKSAATDAPTLNPKLLPGNIAYIRLPDFSSPDVVNAMFSVLAKMHKDAGGKFNGIVLDLRGNPGGIFDLAISVSSMFLEEGTVVMSKTRTGLQVKDERFSVIKALPHDIAEMSAEQRALAHDLETAPMSVLIDGSTASSAEIVTGALKDNGRAIIVGTTTWGKGVGYQAGRHRAGGHISITSLSYLTPSGFNLANKGIAPNVEVAQPRGGALDVPLDAAIKAVKAQQITPTKPITQGSSPLQLIDPNSVLVRAGTVALFLLVIVLYGVHMHMRARREHGDKRNKKSK